MESLTLYVDSSLPDYQPITEPSKYHKAYERSYESDAESRT